MDIFWDQDVYLKTLRFAAMAHKGQFMSGGELPYLMHVTMVSMEVKAALRAEPAAGHAQDLAVQCALLHDVLEDTLISYATLAEAFGEAVAAGVLTLTKDITLPKAQQMPDSLTRIQEQPHAVWLVKLADRITNLQPPPAHWSAEKIAAYRVQAGEILAALAPASPFLAGRLAAKIAVYEV